MTGGIHRVPSWAWKQAMSERGAVNLTQREGRRGVTSLGGVCWPAEPQKEMQVPRTGCAAAGRKQEGLATQQPGLRAPGRVFIHSLGKHLLLLSHFSRARLCATP